jgi:hypothetical protein
MKSSVIKAASQFTLDFEPGLVERYGSLRECIAAGVYQRGLGSVAIDLDEAPGNLSVKLSANDVRHFHVENLERYLEKTGDLTPIYYLAEKFLSDSGAKQKAASAELLRKMAEISELMKRAGVAA